jgi:ABC-type phosphate transport system substrate-binding protein
MKSRTAKWLFTLTALFLSLSGGRERAVRAQESDAIVMVVNKNNIMAAGMGREDIRKLLLGETSTWRDGTKVVVVLQPAGNPDRAAVLKKICGMSESAYTRFEMQASFTGQTPATVEVAATDSAIKTAIKSTTGAIGFLRRSQVDASVRAGLELP